MSYEALASAWNAAKTPPDGVAGLPLDGLSTAEKIEAVNDWTTKGPTVDVSAVDIKAYLGRTGKIAGVYKYADSPPV